MQVDGSLSQQAVHAAAAIRWLNMQGTITNPVQHFTVYIEEPFWDNSHVRAHLQRSSQLGVESVCHSWDTGSGGVDASGAVAPVLPALGAAARSACSLCHV